MEYLGTEELAWLRRFLPFAQGLAPAQTMRRTLAGLHLRQLEVAFSGWVAELAARIRGVIAIDGKTLRGSRRRPDGTGAVHLVQAYALEAAWCWPVVQPLPEATRLPPFPNFWR